MSADEAKVCKQKAGKRVHVLSFLQHVNMFVFMRITFLLLVLDFYNKWATTISLHARKLCQMHPGMLSCLSSLASSISPLFSLGRTLRVFVNCGERPETQQNLGHALIVFMPSLPLSKVFVFH